VDVPYIFPVGFLFVLLIYLVTGVFSDSLFLTVLASKISSTFYQETCSLMVPTLMKCIVIHQVSYWSPWRNFALELFYQWICMEEQELQFPLLEGPLQHTRHVHKETELFKYRANQHREPAAATERT